MSDIASYDAAMQCSMLEVFCEALGAAVFLTDRLDRVSFASVRLLHLFAIPEACIRTGARVRDLYAALYDAGCRFGASPAPRAANNREDWVAERVAHGWKERMDRLEQGPNDRWFRLVSRRFSSGLGMVILQDVTDHKKKELSWKQDQERVRLTEEILDTLPVAIAIKDRNLNFAAVNQRFSRLYGIEAERVLGKSIWDVFEPPMAQAMEKSDWSLLASGEDREMVMDFPPFHSHGAGIVHRARRIGKPGNHYISMTFEEIPTGVIAAGAGFSSSHAPATEATNGESTQTRQRLVYYGNEPDERKIAEYRAAGAEMCVISILEELRAFLPAARSAGIHVDRVLIQDPDPCDAIAVATGNDVEFEVIEAAKQDRVSDPVEPGQHKLQIMLNEDDGRETVSDTLDILAVEDNAINRMALSQIFESLGLSSYVAASGGEALAKLEQTAPKMVLADVSLPDMPPIAFSEAVTNRLGARRQDLPIVAMIHRDDDAQRDEYERGGYDDVLAKPISPEAIDEMLRRHLYATGSTLRKPPMVA